MKRINLCAHVDEGTHAKEVGFAAVPTDWLGELAEAGFITCTIKGVFKKSLI